MTKLEEKKQSNLHETKEIAEAIKAVFIKYKKDLLSPFEENWKNSWFRPEIDDISEKFIETLFKTLFPTRGKLSELKVYFAKWDKRIKNINGLSKCYWENFLKKKILNNIYSLN